jgi:hypothetical protein
MFSMLEVLSKFKFMILLFWVYVHLNVARHGHVSAAKKELPGLRKHDPSARHHHPLEQVVKSSNLPLLSVLQHLLVQFSSRTFHLIHMNIEECSYSYSTIFYFKHWSDAIVLFANFCKYNSLC